jgi:hypothetical protein
MRKLVLFCLALALAATSVPALAASQIDFSGYFKVFHENLHNFGRAPRNNTVNSPANIKDNDSFFENKLQINLEIQPNDDITVYWMMRTMNYQRWGSTTTGNVRGTGVYTQALYAEVRQPWGTVQIGRLIDGLGSSSGGLASLGYVPTWGAEFSDAEPFDTGNATDSVVYSYDFGNGFALAAYYAKDALDPAVRTAAQVKDADIDRFGIEPRYQWDDGGVSLGVAYIRDKSLSLDFYNDTAPPPIGWYTGFTPKSAWQININPAFVQSWGPFSIHFEGVVAFGKSTFSLYDNATNAFYENEFRNKGLGLYLDASYNYGAGDVTLMSWYTDGTSYEDLNKDNPTLHSAVGMGNFYPFLVAYNNVTLAGNSVYSNILSDNFTFIPATQAIGVRQTGGEPLDFSNTNHWALALMGNHAFTDDISVNYGIAYFRLVSLPPSTVINNRVVPRPNRSKSLGVEIDLGATFQILDNLSFETKFGYMFNGSAYRNSWYVGNDPVFGPKPKDTFAWANVLAVTF